MTNTNREKAFKDEVFLKDIENTKKSLGLKEYETPKHNFKGLREALPHNCIAALKLRKDGFLGTPEYWQKVKEFYKEEAAKWWDPKPTVAWCRQMVEMRKASWR